MEETIIANVVLRAKDGSSILDTEEPITSKTAVKYKVDDEHIRAAIQRLSAYGFNVQSAGPYSLSLTGNKGLFERVFHTKLRPRSVKLTKPDDSVASRTFYEAQEPIIIPEDLLPYIADVTFPVPPEFFH